MNRARAVIGAIGVGVAGFGVFTLVTTLRFDQLVGLAIWLAGAVVVHDAIFAPLTAVFIRVVERGGRPLPSAARLCVRLGFAVGVVISLLALPEIYARSRGPANPTILAGDFALRLAVVWAVILVSVSLICLVMVARRRRTSARRRATPARARGPHGERAA